jgi:hypothetical protein
MIAFEAAEKNGGDGALKKELDALFESKTSSSKSMISVPATFLPVTVAMN